MRDNLLETGPAKVTTQGDTLYATGANALARLAKGTAGQTLRMNAGATAPEWFNGCPAGMIVMWSGTIASIPSGWVICDGNNGTPNLLAKFVKGVATAATNPGATGGSTTHTHAAHAGFEDSPVGGAGGRYEFNSDAARSHDSPNHEPPYYAIAFIMKS